MSMSSLPVVPETPSPWLPMTPVGEHIFRMEHSEHEPIPLHSLQSTPTIPGSTFKFSKFGSPRNVHSTVTLSKVLTMLAHYSWSILGQLRTIPGNFMDGTRHNIDSPRAWPMQIAAEVEAKLYGLSFSMHSSEDVLVKLIFPSQRKSFWSLYSDFQSCKLDTNTELESPEGPGWVYIFLITGSGRYRWDPERINILRVHYVGTDFITQEGVSHGGSSWAVRMIYLLYGRVST
jgi:hypothetical protein